MKWERFKMFCSTKKLLDAAGKYFFQKALEQEGITIGPHWKKGNRSYNR
jgi:hypothetical protein